jgi:hypothetical protein
MTMTLTRSPEQQSGAPAVTRRRRRRWPAFVTLLAGGVLLGGALAWSSIAVPALVKFPTDVDQRPRYEGTFTLFVDPATTAPLVEPTVAGLTVDRHVEGLPAESGASRVVVRETIAYEIEGLASASQVHQYVMDRSTNANVADDRAWAFEETNVLDRSGAYWLALSEDVDHASTLPMFKDEVGGRFDAVRGSATEEVEGLDLVAVESPTTTMTLTEAYLRSLDAVVPLPRQLTFDELRPSLIAAGVPVDDTMAALLEVATTDDLTTLTGLIGQPIPLEYVMTFSGTVFAEPDTGAIVDASTIVERVGARPAGDAVPTLLAVLDRYREEPAIAEAIASLERLATEPLPVFENRYAQTPATVDEMAAWVSDQKRMIRLAERTIPLGLVVVGALTLTVGGLLFVRAMNADPRRMRTR